MENTAWHIPKRSNLLQAIGSLFIIKLLNLDGKKWVTTGTAKTYNQALGTWGLTTSGDSLSNTARETLEAYLKFMGLIYLDLNKVVHITPAGHELIKEFSTFKKPASNMTLNQSEKVYNFNYSKTIKSQLIKLVISNPTLPERNISKEFCLNPFIETLRYLIDKDNGFLTREEITMFVFFQKTPLEFEKTKKNILNFRKLSNIDKIKKIKEFSETYIGNKIYGESSATVKYWENIVKSTGLFQEDKIGFYLEGSKLKEAIKIVENYEYPSSEVFDNEILWWEYYGNNLVSRLPRKLDFTLPKLKDNKLILVYEPINDKFLPYFEQKLKTEGDTLIRLTVFPDVEYEIIIKILIDEKGNTTTHNFKESFSYSKNEFTKEFINNVEVKNSSLTSVNFIEELKAMIDSNSVSSEYLKAISQSLILQGVVKNKQEANNYIQPRMSVIKGGRFERLFYELLKKKEKEKVIDKVTDWRGRESNGISFPSPAGLGSETDIEFIVDSFHFGLELTTATGRQQWKTEAESVTDHMNKLNENLKIQGSKYKAVGIFTAPVITEFMKAICYYFSEVVNRMPILAIKSKVLVEMLDSSKSKKDFKDKISKYNRTIYKKYL